MKDETRISPTCAEGRHAACVGAFAPLLPGTFVYCDCVCHAGARVEAEEAQRLLDEAPNVAQATLAAEQALRAGELAEAATWLHDLKDTEGYTEERRYSIFCMRHFQREPREMVNVDGPTRADVVERAQAAGFVQQADGSYLCAECVRQASRENSDIAALQQSLDKRREARDHEVADTLQRLLDERWRRSLETTQNLHNLSDRTRYSLALDMLQAGGAWPSLDDSQMQFSHFDADGTQNHSIVLYYDDAADDARAFATETFAAFGFETVWTGPDRLRLRSEEELRAGRRF